MTVCGRQSTVSNHGRQARCVPWALPSSPARARASASPTARALARAGAPVALLALPGAALDDAVAGCRTLGAPATAVACDVGDPAAVAAAFAAAEAELGPLAAIANNAGTSRVIALSETTDEDWQALLRTNLTGSFNVLRAAVRAMLPRGRGVIVTPRPSSR